MAALNKQLERRSGAQNKDLFGEDSLRVTDIERVFGKQDWKISLRECRQEEDEEQNKLGKTN